MSSVDSKLIINNYIICKFIKQMKGWYDMVTIDVSRLLGSVGMRSYVINYYDYKNSNLDKKEFAKKLLNENPRAKSIDAQITRISKARKLFDNNQEIIALQLVVDSDSSQIDIELKKKAQEIINKERVGK